MTSRPQQKRGMILIVVVVVVMLIGFAGYNFTLSMQSEHLAARNSGDRMAAQQAAMSGQVLLSSVLESPRRLRPQMYEMIAGPIDLWPDETSDEQGDYLSWIQLRRLAIESEAGPQSQSSTSSFGGGSLFSSLSQPQSSANAATPISIQAQLGNSSLGSVTTATGVVISESAKLDLQTLLDWDFLITDHGRNALMQLPGMDQATADRLLDWIDSDSTPRAYGDEENASNSIPLVVDELAWLGDLQSANSTNSTSGYSDLSSDLAAQYSSSSQGSGMLSSQGIGLDGGSSGMVGDGVSGQREDEQKQPLWLQFLTTSSAERNEDHDGQPRINVNGSDLSSLHRDLSAVLPLSIANYIVLVRQYGYSTVSGGDTDASQIVIDYSKPGEIVIPSLTQLVDSSIEIPGDEEPLIVRSPIRLGGGELAVDEILDRLTLSTINRLVGRVDVLTAPPEVLAGIPNIGAETAERIVTARATATQRFRHPIGLLNAAGISLDTMSRFIDDLTVAGDVVRAELHGSIGNGVPPYRCEVILDASESATRKIYFRQLTPIAMPLPPVSTQSQ